MPNALKIPSKKELEQLCKKFRIKFLVLFGSQISKKTHKESDIDIAIYPAKDVSEKNKSKLEKELARLFKNPNIDLVNLKTSGPLLQKEVVIKGKLLYAEDKESFPLFQMYAMSAYYEFQPYLELREKTIEEKMKKLTHSK